MITTPTEECAAEVSKLIQKYGITAVTTGIIAYFMERLHNTSYPKTMKAYVEVFTWVLDMLSPIQHLDTNEPTGSDLSQPDSESLDGD